MKSANVGDAVAHVDGMIIFIILNQFWAHHFSQIGPSPRSQYTELANGSLLLKPLSKDHHGGWECLATNRVATLSAGTVVMVLGKLPH